MAARFAAPGDKVGLAWELHRTGQSAKAERLCRDILNARPSNAQARHLLGLVALDRGDPVRAEEMLRGALRIDPTASDAWSNHASILLQLGRGAEALESLDRALTLEPDFAGLHYNRGNVLADHLDRPIEAVASYDRAIVLDPSHADALLNRGNVLAGQLGRRKEALADYERAIALRPEHADSHINAAMYRLMLGDFAGGWPDYEWRWHTADHEPPRAFGQMAWRGGEAVSGQTILLYAEQGFGDSIQFARYIPMVVALGARVVMEVQPALMELLADCFPDVRVFPRGAALPAFDRHCPLASLPLAFSTNSDSIPNSVPYLRADPARVEQWRYRAEAGTGKLIGIAWSGNPDQGNDHNRSAPWGEFAKLLDPAYRFVSLQPDVRDRDQAIAAGVLDWGVELRSFADTAALVAALDLVISVDTSVAHLAGSMGRPVWIPLSFRADWRWMADRQDSPWYPTAKIFRQPRLGDWGTVIEQVATGLASAF